MRSRTTPLPLVVPLVLGLSACAGVAAHTSPSAAVSPSPALAVHVAPVPTGLGKGGVRMHPPSPVPPTPEPTPFATDVAGAAAIITRVKDVSPRLLPNSIPAGMDEVTVTAAPGRYEVQYTDDTHARTIFITTDQGFGINGPHQVVRDMQFRGQKAFYQVFDTTVPTSRHQLYWSEPGSQVEEGQRQSAVLYMLFATGLTEAEFFQVANSLQPV